MKSFKDRTHTLWHALGAKPLAPQRPFPLHDHFVFFLPPANRLFYWLSIDCICFIKRIIPKKKLNSKGILSSCRYNFPQSPQRPQQHHLLAGLCFG
ncbi:hypothetical protein CDAR_59211 [Caerostris darwini]|uniref:Uncharacterized protein n=1 Tax=Caerostris darwini TaxID=1538125 RepID=A0AAV4X5H2_9ARAC|nr:hypothetical protein CDAR_59211 [Caerostris darwini]